MDLQARLEEVEGEYRAGELTEIGYRRRKVRIQKDILKREFGEGELTQEGYTRKMARLEEPSSSKSICKQLSQPEVSVKEKIKELFARGSSKSCPLPKKKITKQTERNTTVTLVCVDKKTFSTPSRKVRNNLVAGGKIKEMFVRPSESKRAIMEKLHEMFPSFSSFSFLKATASKDLIPASLSEEDSFGEALLKLTDGHDLYVVGSIDQGSRPAPISPSQQLSDNPGHQSNLVPTTLSVQQEIGHVSQLLSPAPTPLSQQQHTGSGQRPGPSPTSVSVRQQIGHVSQHPSRAPTPLSQQQHTGNGQHPSRAPTGI